jgi:hypothetical protein
MSKQTASQPRRRRRWWLIPVGILAAIALVAVGVTIANLASPNTTRTPAGAASGAPTGTGSTAPVEGVDYASGCVAGPDITSKDLLALREKKQFTPAGAAEFLGAFMQLYSAADPDRRPNLRETVNDVTDGTAHSMLAASDLSKSGYDDGQTHGVDLSGSAYLVRDSTDTTVTIAFAGLTTTNGKPDPAEDSASKYQYTGGTFTLTTSAQGWVISDADPSPGWDEGLTSGTKYKEGC